MLRQRTVVWLEALDRPHLRFERCHKPIAEREKLIVRSGLEVTVADNPLAQEPMSDPVAFSHQLIKIVGSLGLQVRRYRFQTACAVMRRNAASKRMISFCERGVLKSPDGRDGFLRCVCHQTNASPCSHIWTVDMTSP